MDDVTASLVTFDRHGMFEISEPQLLEAVSAGWGVELNTDLSTSNVNTTCPSNSATNTTCLLVMDISCMNGSSGNLNTLCPNGKLPV